MRGFLALLDRLASGRVVLVLLAVVLAIDAVLAGWVAPRIAAGSDGGGPLDLSLTYTADEAYARIAVFDEDTRRFYAVTEATLDVLFPLAYSLFFACLILYLLRRADRQESRLRWMALAPFGALIADLLENAGIVALLVRYPARMEGVAAVTGWMTLTKWAFVGVTVVVVLAAVVLVARRRGDSGAG